MRIMWGRFISPALAMLGQTPVLAHAVEKRNVLLIISAGKSTAPAYTPGPPRRRATETITQTPETV
jgi:hypothetical protein